MIGNVIVTGLGIESSQFVARKLKKWLQTSDKVVPENASVCVFCINQADPHDYETVREAVLRYKNNFSAMILVTLHKDLILAENVGLVGKIAGLLSLSIVDVIDLDYPSAYLETLLPKITKCFLSVGAQGVCNIEIEARALLTEEEESLEYGIDMLTEDFAASMTP